ncbi:MAG: amino acid adenylation domain-containing protein, partial [Xenococcus sp. MO_188.B8]|nr:amino acid adenylation domain-containing protein [Xenococcus sp. MO_188.B8]
SGEPLLPADVSQWMQIYGERIQLVNLYGASETTMTKFFYFVQASDRAKQTIPIGKPMDGTAAIIVGQNGKICPPGIVGEIYIRTPYRTLGYYQQPELTQEVFIPNPFTNKPHDIVYKTGDLGRILQDGNFEYLGRKDRQVKIRGIRIELAEIENALSRHPQIQEAVVKDWEDCQGNKYLCGYLLVKEPLKSHQIREFLVDWLAEPKIPTIFTIMDRLPKTISGKIDRKSLPEPQAQERIRPLIRPRNPIEEELVKIWEQVLKVNPIGIEDNFFALGGHSLLVTQLTALVEQSFKVKLPLKIPFESPQLAKMAGIIQKLQDSQFNPSKSSQNQGSRSLFSSQSPAKETTQTISKVSRPAKLPLSFAAARLWFMEQLNPNTSAYNMPIVIRLQGALNIAALEKSFNAIIARHEILRTAFRIEAGEPVQVIIPHLTLPLKKVNLTQPSSDSPANQIQKWAETEASQSFDLTKAPLLRATLLELGARDYVLSLVIHHIIFDAWSTDVLIRELSLLYPSFCAGKPSPLGDLPFQYADFALWQRQCLSEAKLAPQMAYWKKQLGDNLVPLQLPGDHPRPPIPSFQGKRYPLKISASLTEQLNILSQQQGITLFMTLLAVFKILLYRYSSQESISVGTAIAGRNHPDLKPLIGCFVNTLVLRTNLANNPTFLDLLARVKNVALEAYSHQDLPLEKVVEELSPERNLSHSPLFQVGFTFYNESRPELTLEELTIAPLNIDSETSKLDLTLSLRKDRAGGLQGWIEYSRDLFEEATIVRMIGHWPTLLESVIANPEQPIDRLPLLTTAERAKLLGEWNNTAQKNTQEICLPQQWESQVQQTPNAIALEFAEQKLTYTQLNEKVNQLAHYLQKLGIKPETRVGIYLERSIDGIIAILGILKAGGAYVPLDPNYPPQRLAFMVENSQISLILTQDYLIANLEQIISAKGEDSSLLNPRLICLNKVSETIAQETRDNPHSLVKPSNLAYIIYTSGSTGQPKGVLIEHRGLVNLAKAQIQTFQVNQKSRILQFASLNFDASVSEILMALLAGATLCLAKSSALLPGKPLMDLLANLAITTVTLPPSILAVLRVSELPALKTLIVAGESASPNLLRHWATSGRKIFNAYGPTESTVCATIYDCSNLANQRQIPIGRPIANTQIYILDQHLQPVPIGIVGELYLGGVGIARGYQGRINLTREKFIPNPFGSSKLYKTGDLARYLPDGKIEFLGRRDNQVKMRGFRIELGEIEQVLETSPQVQSSAVIARKNKLDHYLVAYIVPQQQENFQQKQLQNYLRQQLPHYMMPSNFVILEQLPLTTSGKVDRRILAEQDISQETASEAIVNPRDNIELELVQIWEQVLNHRPINITDNFFDLGGHSLLAVRLMALIEERFGSELPLATLFENGTIEDIAMILRSSKSQAKPWSPVVKIKPGGAKMPFFCVHPIGGNVIGYMDLARYFPQDQPFYGLQAPGMEEAQQPYENISDLADYYLDVLTQMFPHNSYSLGGHSFGGLVAFEIARKMEQQGLDVASLVIMDTPAPIDRITEAAIDDAMWLVRRAETLEHFFGKPLSISYEDIQGQQPQAQFNYFLQKLRKANLIPADAGETIISRILQLQKAGHQALLNYVPQVYSGKITLIQASDKITNTSNNERGLFSKSFTKPALGWGELSLQDVQVYNVPGNHITMLTSPHVRVLAETLQFCLTTDKAERKKKWGRTSGEQFSSLKE